ncbi:hypothetical protein AHAS_Ahas12G0197100 [Arachis hypogaea]
MFFRKLSKEKKVIVDEMVFGTLSHIPSLNVTHKLLKELTNSFDFYENKGCPGLKYNR